MTATTVALRNWHRLRVNGAQAEMAADVTQNEALEGIVTTVADVELETEITLATGLPVDLMYVEQIAEQMAWQFSGTVNHVAGQSFPNRVVLTCVGPLAHLRRCPTVDHDLTGMTEGEAAQHILTACNVTYDSADIADSGYVLGAQTPVLWLKDQPGHEMLAELDSVFGMATIEVGQGRVVRFPYDRAPDAAAISKTYTRGADVDFWGNQRDKGDFDSIINLVQVRGATWTDSGNKCNYTPWSRGSANNADLGGTARNRSQSFQSDLIQDEALATAVATRLMRWGNRQPDAITLVAQNDPTLNCGAVIGVKDGVYGIGLTGDATATPYLVLTIDRRGHEMTLNCVGGAAGATGTITHGVEKVCNKTSSNFPIPGLFTPPAIGYPPLLDWLPYAAGTDGAPGDADRSGPEPGTGGTTCAFVSGPLARWTEVNPTLTVGGGHITTSVQGSGYLTGPVVDLTTDWTIDATVTMDGGSYSHDISIGLGGTSASLAYGVNLMDTDGGFIYANFDDYAAISGGGWTDGEPIHVLLNWHAGTQTLAATITQGARTETPSVVQGSSTYSYHHYAMVASAGTISDSAGLDVSAFTMTQESNPAFCAAGGLTADGWHTVAGSATYGSDSISSTGTGGDTESFFNGDGYPFNLSKHAIFSGFAHFSSAGVGGTDAPICQVGFAVADGSHFSGLEVQWDPNFAPDATLNIYVNGVYQTSFTVSQATAVAGWNYVVDLNGPAGTLAIDWNNGAQTWSGSLAAQPDSELAVRFFSGTAIGFGVDSMSLEVG